MILTHKELSPIHTYTRHMAPRPHVRLLLEPLQRNAVPAEDVQQLRAPVPHSKLGVQPQQILRRFLHLLVVICEQLTPHL